MELEIKNITKRFNDKIAVNKFNVTLSEGIYGLLGPNGSGKTTLMRMIADVVKPTEGKILLNGKNKDIMDEDYRDLIGYLPQDIGFYDNFTAEKFLYYVAALKGIDKKSAAERIDSLLHYVNLEGDRNRKIKGFSGGMKERLGIAQALLNDPKILILDEPTAGLDPNERIRFKNMIARLSKDKIVILSTHIVSDVEFLANEIIIMKQGELVEKNMPADITNKMRGKVWSLIVDEQKYGDIMCKYKISKTSMDNGFVTVRIVSDEKPAESAVPQNPTLEDMFLYYFGEVDEKL